MIVSIQWSCDKRAFILFALFWWEYRCVQLKQVGQNFYGGPFFWCNELIPSYLLSLYSLILFFVFFSNYIIHFPLQQKRRSTIGTSNCSLNISINISYLLILAVSLMKFKFGASFMHNFSKIKPKVDLYIKSQYVGMLT